MASGCHLSLAGTPVTAAGLEHLARLPALTWLDLGGCVLTDDALAAVAKSSNLQSLFLAEAKFSDAGLKHLASLKYLGTLNLTRTAVSEAKSFAMADFCVTDLPASLVAAACRVSSREHSICVAISASLNWMA